MRLLQGMQDIIERTPGEVERQSCDLSHGGADMFVPRLRRSPDALSHASRPWHASGGYDARPPSPFSPSSVLSPSGSFSSLSRPSSSPPALPPPWAMPSTGVNRRRRLLEVNVQSLRQNAGLGSSAPALPSLLTAYGPGTRTEGTADPCSSARYLPLSPMGARGASGARRK